MNVDEYLKEKSDSFDVHDVQILLAHTIGRPRTWLLAHLDAALTQLQIDSANDSFSKLKDGIPLPYIIGHWEVFGLDLEITKDTLIPRPETELLIEKAILWLQKSSEKKMITDVGTGSGAIAISLATHVPNARIMATDISPKALEVARRNAMKFNVSHQIQFIECDLFPDPQPLSLGEKGAEGGVRAFDLICANLPYIPTKTLHGLPIYMREPTVALDGGADGFDLYRRLLQLAPKYLNPKGLMLLEIESTQGKLATDIARTIFKEGKINLYQDLAGRDRLLEIKRT